MIASSIEMSFIVRRTLKPAPTRGVTCSNAALISREYGMPIPDQYVDDRFNLP